MQGFDKYGVGAYTCVPTMRLQKALGFKVKLVFSVWLQSPDSHLLLLA